MSYWFELPRKGEGLSRPNLYTWLAFAVWLVVVAVILVSIWLS